MVTTNPLFEIWRIGRRAGSLLDDALGDAGLSATDFGLYSLLRYGAPLTARDIVDRTGMPATTVSQQVRRLDARGHLRREPHPDDARATLLSLSDAGVAAHEAAAPAFRAALSQVEAALGEDHDQVLYSLRRLDRALRSAADDPLSDPPARLPARPDHAVARHITYSGDPLTDEEAERVREFIAWLRWRRAAS